MNKYSLFAKVAGKYMHVFSYPTKKEAENARQYYYRHHPGHKTSIRKIKH